MNGNQIRHILISLNDQVGGDKIKEFFIDELKYIDNEKKITLTTVGNFFNKNAVSNIRTKTENFFKPYTENIQNHPNFSNLLKNTLNIKSFEGEWFAPFLNTANDNVTHKQHIDNSDYIGQLQNSELTFHQNDQQLIFWKKLYDKTKNNIKKGFQTVSDKNGNKFHLSFIKISNDSSVGYKIKSCELEKPNKPLPTESPFAKKVMKYKPTTTDGLSFGLKTYKIDEANKSIELKFQYQRYLNSLEEHDAFYMKAIYAFGTTEEKTTINNLVANVARVYKNTVPSYPILGVTTAVIFKREKDDRYWTFVQLKEGGASRIPESHLAPSFVHQPVTGNVISIEKQIENIVS